MNVLSAPTFLPRILVHATHPLKPPAALAYQLQHRDFHSSIDRELEKAQLKPRATLAGTVPYSGRVSKPLLSYGNSDKSPFRCLRIAFARFASSRAFAAATFSSMLSTCPLTATQVLSAAELGQVRRVVRHTSMPKSQNDIVGRVVPRCVVVFACLAVVEMLKSWRIAPEWVLLEGVFTTSALATQHKPAREQGCVPKDELFPLHLLKFDIVVLYPHLLAKGIGLHLFSRHHKVGYNTTAFGLLAKPSFLDIPRVSCVVVWHVQHAACTYNQRSTGRWSR
ncbi:hypothetical protein B0H67DRAFT_588844 [Lasiosphaeris hirsuta]|uniref:Uncharacterized protein n=1 Tax=Lasiosphaeris hirsuta TaxID=260670 RepID=A0AA40DLB2_9PEZI|nr:hypothetical protein B0H67DRAFT_588844 [Lasiosphaeris hirsuta]